MKLNRTYWIAIVTTISSFSVAFGQGPSTYKATAKSGRVNVLLQEYPGAFRNPLKGFREFFAPGIDTVRFEYPYPYGSLVKEYMQWNMIEQDTTDDVKKIIAYSDHRWKGVAEMNVKVIPRVYLVWIEPWHGGKPKNPELPDDLNGWHWPKDIPPEKGPYKQIPGSVGATVDASDRYTPITGGYFSPGFQERVRKLVKKMGEAWDNDPRVAYVEMGIVGEWGEQHDPDLSTYWPPHDEPAHVVNRTWIPGMEKTLGDAFKTAFKNKKVMVRYAYEFNDYKFGIYWDSWAQPEENVRGYEAMKKLGNRWRTQPIGGEITWGWGSLAKFKSIEEVLTDSVFFALTLKQIRDLHCNHLGGITWANFKKQDFAKAAQELQKAMGYRFVVADASYPATIAPGKAFLFDASVTNTGSSPFYYNWPVQLALLNEENKKPVWTTLLKNVTINEWMPGDDWNERAQKYNQQPPIQKIKSIVTVKDIPKGRYILALSILDPAGMRPAVRFANTNYFTGGYLALGYIGVQEKITNFKIAGHLFSDIQSDTTLYYKRP